MPTVERTTRSGPIHLHYQTAGRKGAPCVILGHSFLCSGAMWREQIEPLAAGHRVLNVDFRGHGGSGHATSPFTIEDLADDLVAVLDAEGVETATWGGLSIGGMTALRAALRHPDRVDALMILDSHAGDESAWKRVKYRLLATASRALGVRPLIPAITPLMFGSTTRRERPELVAEWTERFAALHVPSIWHGIGALNGRDSVVGRLGEIRVPTLVLVGSEDRALPPRCSEELARGLPDVELVVVPGAGHLAALEQPEAVIAAMTGFLERRVRRH